MYGQPWREVIPILRRDRPIAIVVGGAKVPGEVYGICQHNIGIGNQPHSEVAALAVFLRDLLPTGSYPVEFPGGELDIVPSASNKMVSQVEYNEDE